VNYQVRTLRRAKHEFSAIARWYFERSSDNAVAETWLHGVQDLVDSLADNPHRGALARESESFEEAIYELNYGSGRRKTHRILFRIIEDENLVEVVGVRHTAQRDLTPDDI